MAKRSFQATFDDLSDQQLLEAVRSFDPKGRGLDRYEVSSYFTFLLIRHFKSAKFYY